jgi:N-acetylneuraminate synthase
VWDKTSAREIISINPEFIKVGSPSNLNFDMQKLLRDEYTGDVHISFGMTTQDEIETIMEFWKGYENRLIVYSCTSDYPVKFDDVCLLHIQELSNKYGHLIKGIGFSGHHLGIAVDIGARALGANWIGRHFTLDRTMKGTDHSASLESPGLQKLIRDLSAIDKALKSRPIGILDCEIPSRQPFKYNSQIS